MAFKCNNSDARSMYALQIQYNDANPIVAIRRQMGAVNAVLSAQDGTALTLVFDVKDGEETKKYRITTIKPGDHLKFTIIEAASGMVETISGLDAYNESQDRLELRPGFRLGIDVELCGEIVRLSHPPNGYFTLIIGGGPKDHMRAFILAGNKSEFWRWQLKDIYIGDCLDMTIVETDWNTPFPHIEQRRWLIDLWLDSKARWRTFKRQRIRKLQ